MSDVLACADTALNEWMIGHCYRMLVASLEHDQRMHWWDRMGYYIKQRSPETIRQIERKKGLA